MNKFNVIIRCAYKNNDTINNQLSKLTVDKKFSMIANLINLGTGLS